MADPAAAPAALQADYPPALDSRLAGVQFGAAGLLLGAGVLVATYWLVEGSASAQVLGRALMRRWWWRAPAAALIGLATQEFYRALLAPGPVALRKVGAVCVGCVRAFVVFPMYGMMALLGILFGGAITVAAVLKRKLTGEAPPPEGGRTLVERWLGIPMWLIVLPFTAAGLQNEGAMPLPVTLSRRTLLRWLLALCLMLGFFSRFRSEETGELVDPYWLATFANYWFADYLFVAFGAAPLMRARRGLDE